MRRTVSEECKCVKAPELHFAWRVRVVVLLAHKFVMINAQHASIMISLASHIIICLLLTRTATNRASYMLGRRERQPGNGRSEVVQEQRTDFF